MFTRNLSEISVMIPGLADECVALSISFRSYGIPGLQIVIHFSLLHHQVPQPQHAEDVLGPRTSDITVTTGQCHARI